MNTKYTPTSAIVGSLLIIALGVVLIAFPAAAVKVAVIGFGIYTILEGAFALSVSFRLKEVDRLFFINMVKALINLFIGILVVYFAATAPGSTVADWVVYIIAIDLLLSALTELFELHLIRKAGLPFYGLPSGAGLSVVFAVVMFIFPSLVSSVVPAIIGSCLIVAGVFSILWSVRMYLFARDLGKAVNEENTVEAEWTEK